MPDYDDDDQGLEEGSHKPFCPKCGSIDIRVSHSERMLDFLLKTFSRAPYRCRSCRKRFYLRPPDAEPVLPPEPDNDVAPNEAKPKAKG